MHGDPYRTPYVQPPPIEGPAPVRPVAPFEWILFALVAVLLLSFFPGR
jgi:hypothetical protein